MSNRMTKLLSLLVPTRASVRKLRTRVENKDANSYWLCVAVVPVSLIGTAFYGYLFRQTAEWQFLALAGLILTLGIAALVGAILARKGYHTRGIWVMLLVGQVVVSVSPLFVGGQGIWYGAGVILSSFLIGSLTMTSTHSTRAIVIGVLAGLLTLVVDEYSSQWQTATPQLLSILVIGVVLSLLLASIFYLALFLTDYSLRGKITIAVFSAVLVSIIVLTVINNQTYRRTLIDNANQTLLLAADRTAAEVDAYLTNLIAGLERVNAESPAAQDFLTLSVEERSNASLLTDQLKDTRDRLDAFELILLDRVGVVAFHSTYANVSQFEPYLGLSATDQNLIDISLLGGTPYVSSVIFPTLGRTVYIDTPYIYIGSRITSADGRPMGIMLAGYPIGAIQQIVEGNNGLAGDQSFGVLLDDNFMRIAHGAMADANYMLVYPLSAETFDRLQRENRLPSQRSELVTTNFPEYRFGLDRLYATPFFETQELGVEEDLSVAAGVRLGQKNWILAYMQSRSLVLGPIAQQTRATVLITGMVGVLAIVISTLLAQLISNPIVQLTKIAERASAGELDVKAPVTSADEVGKLGIAFNSMVDQLRAIFQGLEERVRERTAELFRSTEQLEYRATRLQMVAEVAHSFAAVSDPDQLLSLVVKTISERFGFYHVGVFWVDKAREYAVLMASNSEGGQRMLERGHRLRVGAEGLVGFVTSRGEARIALDVGEDAVFFNNPDLPETRSEITLPLKVGTEIIGALDVQSTMPKAFDASDIALLSTLADQVAMAIENTRLINDAQRTVRELEIAQRQYIQRQWADALKERAEEGFRYSSGRLAPIRVADDEQVPDVLPTSPTVIYENPSSNGTQQASGLLVPIFLRGQAIGLIELNDTDTLRRWGEDEISLTASVADQVGQALENARLLETTQRRAERERLVSAITTKLRATNDPQEILETAVQQLKDALKVRKVQVRVGAIANHDDAAHEKP